MPSYAAFVVDEAYLYSLLENPEVNLTRLSEVNDITQECLGFTNTTVLLTKDFYSRTISSGQDVATILFSGDNADLRDCAVRSASLFDRCQSYDPSDYYVDDADLTEDCHYLLHGETGSKGLITKLNWAYLSWWRENDMFHIDEDMSPLNYYRLSIYNMGLSEIEFWDLSNELFPNIYFNADSNRLRFSNLELPIHKIEIFRWIMGVFSYLNDYAISHFLDDPTSFVGKALAHGVELSPESPNTRASTDKMKQRNISIAGEDICCELHVKYAHDRGRIHFHVGQSLSDPIMGITDGRIIVGLFHRHLPI